MTEEKNGKIRDSRLIVALILLLISLLCALIQAWILNLYIDAAVSGNWAYFSETFSVEAPASGPNDFCFDHCVADLPFVAGWIGIVSFLLGVAVLAYSWWTPRSPDPR